MKNILISGAVLLIALGALLYFLQRPAEGLEPIVWDQHTCAHCHMHVGDPRFAAQLQTQEGDVFNFDDPGCLFSYLSSRQVRVREIYFHHYSDDRWLNRSNVGFVQVEQDTPMGYGIGAVDRTQTANAMAMEDASAMVLGKERPGAHHPMKMMHQHPKVSE